MKILNFLHHFASLSLLGLTVSLAGCGQGQSVSGSTSLDTETPTEVRFEELADGVWMHTSYKGIAPWGPFPTNGLIVASGEDGAVLIDTAWNDAQTSEILEWSENVLGRTIRAAVLTHAHDDKMGGVGLLRNTGVTTYAHAQSNVLAPDRGLVAAEFDLQFDIEGLAQDADALLSGLRIFYPGPGHTVDNLVVYIEGSRVLFGGCLIRPGRSFSLGNTADAIIGTWAAAAESVRRRFPDAEIVVPSHGPQGGAELLTHTIDVASSAPGQE